MSIPARNNCQRQKCLTASLVYKFTSKVNTAQQIPTCGISKQRYRRKLSKFGISTQRYTRKMTLMPFLNMIQRCIRKKSFHLHCAGVLFPDGEETWVATPEKNLVLFHSISLCVQSANKVFSQTLKEITDHLPSGQLHSLSLLDCRQCLMQQLTPIGWMDF